MTDKIPDHVLIDGDIICYSVGFASQHTEYEIDGRRWDDKEAVEAYCVQRWGEPEMYDKVIVTEPIEHCLSSVKRMINNIRSNAEADTFRVVISGPDNFRTDIATLQVYKGNRLDKPKPVFYPEIKDYLINVKKAVVTDGEEADDYLSYESLRTGATIATIDKDLNNTPGWHYNWNKKLLVNITPYQASVNFWTQMIVGDSGDHIPGLFRLTGTKASAKMKKRIAQEPNEYQMYRCVRNIWQEAIMSDEREDHEYALSLDETLLEIGRLLHMRTKENELWKPPTLSR